MHGRFMIEMDDIFRFRYETFTVVLLVVNILHPACVHSTNRPICIATGHLTQLGLPENGQWTAL